MGGLLRNELEITINIIKISIPNSTYKEARRMKEIIPDNLGAPIN